MPRQAAVAALAPAPTRPVRTRVARAIRIAPTPRPAATRTRAVRCLPSADTCPAGQYCASATFTCQKGCKSNAECNAFDGAFNVNNRGTCGKVCQYDPSNSTPSCVSGTCKLTCTQLGTANCNGNLADGCEADTLTDSKNCGSCNHACTGNQICQNKSCVRAGFRVSGAAGGGAVREG